jgi:hypothetical protein
MIRTYRSARLLSIADFLFIVLSLYRHAVCASRASKAQAVEAPQTRRNTRACKRS